MTLRFSFLFHNTNERSTPDVILQVYPPTPFLLAVIGTVNFSSFIHKMNVQFFWLLYVYAYGGVVFTPTVLSSNVSERC